MTDTCTGRARRQRAYSSFEYLIRRVREARGNMFTPLIHLYPHTHTQSHTHTHTHTRAHAHARTHNITHTQSHTHKLTDAKFVSELHGTEDTRTRGHEKGRARDGGALAGLCRGRAVFFGDGMLLQSLRAPVRRQVIARTLLRRRARALGLVVYQFRYLVP